MKKLFIVLISTIFCGNSFAALPPEPKEISHQLKLLIDQAAELDIVLTRDKEYYDLHICDPARSDEFKRPLMAEAVTHIYLIPTVRKQLELITRLARQEQTDPEMENLGLAIDAIVPLELKYLKTTYEWEKHSGSINTSPIHPKAMSKPINSQLCLIQCRTTTYQASMAELLNAYKKHRKETQEQNLKEVALLQEEFARFQANSTQRQK